MYNKLKVLVISHNPFSKTASNGKTLEAMFSVFKQENISLLFLRPQSSDLDFDYCSNNYLVSEIDIINRLLLRSKKCGRKIASNEFVRNQSLSYNKKSKLAKHNPLFRDLLWKTNLWKNKEIKDWIRETSADVVFVLGSAQEFTYSIAMFASEVLNVPLVTYFADDFIINPTCNSISEKIHRHRMKHFLNKAIKKSKLRYCIGEMMVQAYAEYFGKEFNHIMNSTEILPYSQFEVNDSIIVSYFGGLHLNRWKMIARIAKLLPKNSSVHVYTFSDISPEIESMFKDNNVIVHNGVVGIELQEFMGKSHVLLHVESDDSYYRSLTQLSISTKIPEYLMHGRLVLGYGPEEVASLRFLSDKGIGLVIPSSKNDAEIKNMLEKSLRDVDFMRRMGKTAYQFAISHFNKVENSTKLYNQLYSIVSNNKSKY